MGYIYLITNNINNKKYIGQTQQSINKRWNQHCYEALNKINDFYLHKAIYKYGKENFTIEQIEECNNNELDDREIYNISKYNTYYIYGQGYNLTRGGSGQTKINQEEIIKQWNEGKSACEISRNFGFYIRTITDVLKNYGITQSDIYSRSMKYGAHYRQKKIYQYDLSGILNNIYDNLDDMHQKTGYRKDYISAACRHTYSSANGYLWIYEDEIENIETLLQKIPKSISQPVLQYDLAGNFIAEFPSYEAAAKVVNCSRSGISKAANNSIITLKGYYWKNKNDTIDIKEKIQKQNNKYSNKKKQIAQLDEQNNILNIYDSIQTAANAMGKPQCRSSIGRVCQGKQKTSCGYKWAYI